MNTNKPWEQLLGESDEHHLLFLAYRNFGPARSLRKVYARWLKQQDLYNGSVRTLHVPGHWSEAATRWQWSARAISWDISNLVTHGKRVAALHAAAIVSIAAKNLRAARRLNPGDKGWANLCKSLELVSQYMHPEVIAKMHEDNQRYRAKAETADPSDTTATE